MKTDFSALGTITTPSQRGDYAPREPPQRPAVKGLSHGVVNPSVAKQHPVAPTVFTDSSSQLQSGQSSSKPIKIKPMPAVASGNKRTSTSPSHPQDFQTFHNKRRRLEIPTSGPPAVDMSFEMDALSIASSCSSALPTINHDSDNDSDMDRDEMVLDTEMPVDTVTYMSFESVAADVRGPAHHIGGTRARRRLQNYGKTLGGED